MLNLLLLFFICAGLCQLDTGSETDLEVAIDPLLCHYQGPIGSLLRRDNLYSNDPSDVYSGLYIFCFSKHSLLMKQATFD